MTLETGTRLGPYEIVAPIGAGGMGEVYHARDTRLGRSVAIKVLPSAFASDARLRIRFDREAKAISALNHPHICTLHDIGQENGVDYLVMEHCEGKTLARRLADGPLSIEQILAYAMQIADALDKAHRQGIIHRDLKPSNIMITKSGVKVLDFGLAKERGGLAPDQSTVQQASEEGALVGTLQYMAPEVLNGKEADARSDIFALGLVMYEMVTGKPAFSGASKAGLIAAILEREPQPLAEFKPETPPALVRLINACLRKDPDERMQAAHDVLMGLKWSAEGSEARSTRRSRLWVASAAILAVAALVTVFIAGRLTRRSKAEQAGRRRLAVMLPAESPIASGNIGSNLFAISPNGERLVYVGPQQALYVRNLDRPTSELIPGTEGATGPFFSPDGNWVAFEVGRKLKKVSLSGGRPFTICEGVPVRGAVWSSDDTIVFAQAAGPLMRVSASGGVPQPALRDKSWFRWPTFLPGGKDLLVTIYDQSGDSDRNQIAVLTLRDEKLHTILRDASHGQYSPTGHLLYVRSGTVYGVAFDAETKTITGSPRPLLDDVAGFRLQGVAYVAVSGKSLYYLPYDPTSEHRELVWVDRRGEPTPVVEQRQGYEGLQLSPDGKQILAGICLRGECDIWRYEIERATWNRVTSDGGNCCACWSPDGRSIVYGSNRNGPPNVFIIPSDGSDQSRQLTHGDSWSFPQSWSPDGKVIAIFEGTPATAGDISLLAVEGNRPPTPYLATMAVEADPNFSPDGQWLAYESSQSGRTEVYIRAANGKGATWKVSEDGGTSPRWRADGKELFYRRQRAMMAIKVTLSPEVSIGKPHVLFAGNFGSGFDVTRDGQRFLMTRNPEVAPRTQINVVEGLLE